MMKLTTLGTGCMFPTKSRSHPGMLLFHEGLYLLFDAGEGVQRQLRIAGISPMDIDYVFITHWHGDHSLGLAGMIQCMSGNRRSKPFTIYGPKGTKEKVAKLISVFDFFLGFPLNVFEVVSNGDFLSIGDLSFSALRLKHGSNCLAFSVIESSKRKINVEFTKKFGLTQHPLLGKLQKGEDIVYNGVTITVNEGTILKPGRKFCYISDTGYFSGIVEFASGADLLLCESTYTTDMEDKADERNHLTAEQAGMIASDAGVKKLVLTHFSQRYNDAKPFVKEAKKFFKDVVAANDFDEFDF